MMFLILADPLNSLMHVISHNFHIGTTPGENNLMNICDMCHKQENKTTHRAFYIIKQSVEKSKTYR